MAAVERDSCAAFTRWTAIGDSTGERAAVMAGPVVAAGVALRGMPPVIHQSLS
jgi:hypothetical protein